MMTPEAKILIQKYGGAAPRYTSFPTAVQFHDGYTRQETQSNLAALKNDEEISTLMCNFEIDLAAYPQSIIPSGRLASLQNDGLIEVINKNLKVTEAGKPFTRVIASAFDPYFSSEGQRHAKAI